MRKILYSILYATVAVVVFSAVPSMGQEAGKSASNIVIRFPFLSHGPYLSSVTSNSIVVAWSTPSPSFASIQYGDTPAYGKNQTDGVISYLHSVTLGGLSANAQYHYRVIAGSDTGSDFTFWTAPDEPTGFTFVAYGDTRTNHDAHVRVLRQIAKTHPRFIINTGDLVGSNSKSNWDKYFADLCDSTSVGQTIPVFASPGNHESGTMYYENLFLPHNNPGNTQAYYSFDYGNVHFVSVNTEISYGEESDQFAWLVHDLRSESARSATFRIVFWHRPPYSSATGHGSEMAVRKSLSPLMESSGVDIVFSGHDHTYERTRPINGTIYIVTGGGGAPLYNFTGSYQWTAYREKTFHFCSVSIDGKTLRMSMIRDDGTVGDSLIIDKNSPNPNVKK